MPPVSKLIQDLETKARLLEESYIEELRKEFSEVDPKIRLSDKHLQRYNESDCVENSFLTVNYDNQPDYGYIFPLKKVAVFGLNRAAKQIKIRGGFNNFINNFNEDSRFILSFNWSNELIIKVCSGIPQKNIISNILNFKKEKCIGFNRREFLLTPTDKFKHFNRLKDRFNVFCGDSLADLLPCLYSDVSFAFKSHDSDFLSVCKQINEKFNKRAYLVNNFNDACSILKEVNFLNS